MQKKNPQTGIVDTQREIIVVITSVRNQIYSFFTLNVLLEEQIHLYIYKYRYTQLQSHKPHSGLCSLGGNQGTETEWATLHLNRYLHPTYHSSNMTFTINIIIKDLSWRKNNCVRECLSYIYLYIFVLFATVFLCCYGGSFSFCPLLLL